MKKYVVWFTFGMTDIRLPYPVEATNKNEAKKKFKREYTKSWNKIIEVSEDHS